MRLRDRRFDPAARPVGHRKLAIADSDPGGRIVDHPAELTELAGVVPSRQCGSEMDRVCIAEAGADMGAETIFDLAGLADAGSCERIAQTAELLDFEADGVDGAVRDERHDLVNS